MSQKGTLAGIGAVLILLGGLLAHFTQTTNGIRIEDVRFKGAKGNTMSALVYIPANATEKTPAPGILAVHGYLNSRETQDGFAIEFARRGYVVVALDQTGHGYSDPPAIANGFGGPDGLTYLRSLPYVDKNNIGLEGHSMGGWTVLAAATAMPDAYRSIVLEGSSTGKPFAADGTPAWPRNLALVFSQYDEFSLIMWGSEYAADVPKSAKLAAVFGVTGPIEPGKVYGDIAQGTARVLYTPAITHPADHFSREAIGYSLDWFGKTLTGGTALPSTDQIWLRKEIGTLIALVGFVFLLLGAFELLLGMAPFSTLRAVPSGPGVTTSARVLDLGAAAGHHILSSLCTRRHVASRIALRAAILHHPDRSLGSDQYGDYAGVASSIAEAHDPKGRRGSIDADCGRDRCCRLCCAVAGRSPVQDRFPVLGRGAQAAGCDAMDDHADLPDPVHPILCRCVARPAPQLQPPRRLGSWSLRGDNPVPFAWFHYPYRRPVSGSLAGRKTDKSRPEIAGRAALHHHRHPVHPAACHRRHHLDVHLATHRHVAAGRADLRSVRYLVHCCRYCDPGCILMSGKESQT
jgi:pimeloyl-ACP methyl ester carboxylesterase